MYLVSNFWAADFWGLHKNMNCPFPLSSISLLLFSLSFKSFSANKHIVSTGGERLFIVRDLELTNAVSISETTPTLTLFKKSINNVLYYI